jgi:hypothetical protein
MPPPLLIGSCQAQLNGTLAAHQMAKAKVEWLIWNEFRMSADACASAFFSNLLELGT